MSLTHASPEAREDFDEFTSDLWSRLDAGHLAYGDASFLVPKERVCIELMQELSDVCGWSFILWRRLKKLREKVQQLGASDV
jgi:hypothetical protein